MAIKRKIKICVLMLTAALCFSATADAQHISDFKQRLETPDTPFGVTVNVTERGTAANVIRDYDYTKRTGTVTGYRVRIFFDNNQNARNEAIAIQQAFRREFPYIPTYLVYESPSFMVTVGNCITIDEALILWSSVKRSFSKAFLWRGEIPVKEFLKEGDGIYMPPVEHDQNETEG